MSQPSSAFCISACRACGSTDLRPLLSLGKTPLANALVQNDKTADPELSYPLEVIRCGSCALVQLTVTVPPETMFRNYVYATSFSDTFLAHSRAIVERVIAARSWQGERLVAEIASNDGYLLQYYKAHGIQVLGIEPARNIAEIARGRGIDTIDEFFGTELARKLSVSGRRADVIHANNVLAHMPDLNGALAGIRLLLKPDGVAIIEAPWLCEMIDRLEFDTIYHEHIFYFSLTALVAAFKRQGLKIADVEHLTMHGGSLRLFATHDDAAEMLPGGAQRVATLLEQELQWGVLESVRYDGFGSRIAGLKSELLALVRQLKAQGKSIAAYGASAKGATLLGYCGLGAPEIEYIVDRSTMKQGSSAPGTHLPIHSPDKLLETQPDFVLLLVWNFAEEIMAQQAEYRARGGQFIIPVPEPKIV